MQNATCLVVRTTSNPSKCKHLSSSMGFEGLESQSRESQNETNHQSPNPNLPQIQRTPRISKHRHQHFIEKSRMLAGSIGVEIAELDHHNKIVFLNQQNQALQTQLQSIIMENQRLLDENKNLTDRYQELQSLHLQLHREHHGLNGIESSESDIEQFHGFNSFGESGYSSNTELAQNSSGTLKVNQQINVKWEEQYNNLLHFLWIACGVGVLLVIVILILLVVYWRLKREMKNVMDNASNIKAEVMGDETNDAEFDNDVDISYGTQRLHLFPVHLSQKDILPGGIGLG